VCSNSDVHSDSPSSVFSVSVPSIMDGGPCVGGAGGDGRVDVSCVVVGGSCVCSSVSGAGEALRGTGGVVGGDGVSEGESGGDMGGEMCGERGGEARDWTEGA
jgi:hypothetical protein